MRGMILEILAVSVQNTMFGVTDGQTDSVYNLLANLSWKSHSLPALTVSLPVILVT